MPSARPRLPLLLRLERRASLGLLHSLHRFHGFEPKRRMALRRCQQIGNLHTRQIHVWSCCAPIGAQSFNAIHVLHCCAPIGAQTFHAIMVFNCCAPIGAQQFNAIDVLNCCAPFGAHDLNAIHAFNCRALIGAQFLRRSARSAQRLRANIGRRLARNG